MSPFSSSVFSKQAHSFLFAQVIRERIKAIESTDTDDTKAWDCVAEEYAVTAADGEQTRIDLVLRPNQQAEKFLCLECKRANPVYKRWTFFDPETRIGEDAQTPMYFETFKAHQRPIERRSHAFHGVRAFQCPQSCPVFKLYLEAVDGAGVGDGKKPGSTATIEEAFRQVIRGQSGFVAKQLNFKERYGVVAFPVVVTTAELVEARYDIGKVSIRSGTLSPSELELKPLEFCAVNYHADDALAIKTEHASPVTNMEDDMLFRQTRTVFVVQSESLLKFLEWFSTNIII